MQLIHEILIGQCQETVSVAGDPIADVDILEASEDFFDFIGISNVFHNEIFLVGIDEIDKGFRGDVTSSENRAVFGDGMFDVCHVCRHFRLRICADGLNICIVRVTIRTWIGVFGSGRRIFGSGRHYVLQTSYGRHRSGEESLRRRRGILWRLRKVFGRGCFASGRLRRLSTGGSKALTVGILSAEALDLNQGATIGNSFRRKNGRAVLTVTAGAIKV